MYIRLKHIAVALLLLFTAVAATAGIHRAVFTYSPSAQTQKSADVVILMYHSILKSSNGSKYIVSPTAFENDLKFLSENGYKTVLMQDLIDFVYEGTSLPEKSVVLTFDDGYYNNYVYIYPLLKRYNAKAVISIVGEYTDEYSNNNDTHVNYAHLSWDNLREMSESGLVEIQNHTYALHSYDKGRKGCSIKSGESVEAYTEMLTKDIGRLQNECLENLGKAPEVFTYPFGFICDESYDIVKNLGFRASLSCREGLNTIERRPEQLYLLKRYLRTPRRGAADIISQLNQ